MHIFPLVWLVSLTSVFAAASSHNETYDATFVAGWYSAWLGHEWPPSKIPWDKYTAVHFAFAETTPDVNALSLDNNSLSVIEDFVSLAEKKKVKSIMSVGGWTGSQFFSSAVATAQNRTAFVKTVVDLATKYKFDGLEFDWEFPNGSGVECNVVSVNDTANFLTFLQALREDSVGKHLLISAAIAGTPFNGFDGKPLTDVSAFAKVLDYAAIMGYDYYGPWSNTAGPNSPLYDSCAPPEHRVGSLQEALKAWTSAGFPAHKLSLGVASYGHSFLVNSSSALDASGNLVLYPNFTSIPNGDKWDDAPGKDQCGKVVKNPGGLFNFWGLVDFGFLAADGKPAHGIEYRYDNCTQTPYVYNKTSQVLVAYDNAQSFAEKGKFVKSNGMKGVSMWTVSGDYQNILINSIRKAVKAQQPQTSK